MPNRRDVALGVDVGTGSTKAALVDEDGRPVAVARAAHGVENPRAGWSETEPSSWLESTRTAVARVLLEAEERGLAHHIVAIGFSGQMHGVVPCRSDGRALRPAVLWSDQRSQQYLETVRSRLSNEAVGRLANPIVAGMTGPTIMALAAEEPQLLDRTEFLVQPKDWVRWQLTGVPATDPSDASATLLWDMTEDRWSPEACAGFGVDRSLLPPVRPSAASAGAVTEAGAAQFGVPAGVPVVVGAADTAAALLGAGVGMGEVQVTTGTGGQIARLSDRRPAGGGGTHVFRAADATAAADPSWYAMAAIQNAGVAIDWAVDLLGVDRAGVAQAVASSPIGANGVTFLPYLTGERTPHLDAGLSGAWSGLRPTTGRDDLLRSVFEGVAFALRDGLDALNRTTTEGADEQVDDGRSATSSALLAGGGSVAEWWRTMLADVLDVTLVPHDAADASVRGAAILAWAGIGRNIDPGDAVTRGDPISPDGDRRNRYAEARGRFRAGYAAGAA